jgi:hypothetical protein
MTYDVIIEADNSAAIERVDMENHISELYFVITFTGVGNIEHGRGIYRFRSMDFLTQGFSDARGLTTIGKTFHGKPGLKRAIEANSLEEACRKFFAEWPEDHYEMAGYVERYAGAVAA